jgi:hypothetical protein
VREVSDGSCFIFAENSAKTEDEIRKYIHEKNIEIWVEILEKNPDTGETIQSLGKQQMNIE